MQKFKLHFIQKQHNKGQSFMEMTFILIVLLMLFVGMVETAFVLNRYSGLVDAARAGARYGASGKTDPYIRTNLPFTKNDVFFERVDEIIEGEKDVDAPGTAGAISPIVLDPTKDDIIIVFYRVVNGSIASGAVFGPWHRFPNYGAATGNHTQNITQADVLASITKNPTAPDTGILVIEIFHDSGQLLKFPIISNYITDPIPLHSYAIMPLALAKPTPAAP